MSLLASQPIWDAPTAILDFETTGLSSAAGDRVVEVAVLRLEVHRLEVHRLEVHRLEVRREAITAPTS